MSNVIISISQKEIEALNHVIGFVARGMVDPKRRFAFNLEKLASSCELLENVFQRGRDRTTLVTEEAVAFSYQTLMNDATAIAKVLFEAEDKTSPIGRIILEDRLRKILQMAEALQPLLTERLSHVVQASDAAFNAGVDKVNFGVGAKSEYQRPVDTTDRADQKRGLAALAELKAKLKAEIQADQEAKDRAVAAGLSTLQEFASELAKRPASPVENGEQSSPGPASPEVRQCSSCGATTALAERFGERHSEHCGGRFVVRVDYQAKPAEIAAAAEKFKTVQDPTIGDCVSHGPSIRILICDLCNGRIDRHDYPSVMETDEGKFRLDDPLGKKYRTQTHFCPACCNLLNYYTQHIAKKFSSIEAVTE